MKTDRPREQGVDDAYVLFRKHKISQKISNLHLDKDEPEASSKSW